MPVPHGKRPVCILILTLAVLAPTSAGADDVSDPGAGEPDLEHYQAQGLGQSRGDPVWPEAGYATDTPPPQHAKLGVMFVNMDGALLNAGQDDSRTNTTQLTQLAGEYPPFGGPESERVATLQAVREDWDAYNVLVVDSRPASGDYTMCMTGPQNFGGILGVAPLDCNDAWPNNVVYAFHSGNDQFGPNIRATTISQEVAHSYGLEHVDQPDDIMNPFNAGGNPSFWDECLAITGGQGILCTSQHAANCASGSQQNSHQELLTIFGPSEPDTVAPLVAITYPPDFQEFEIGADFEITADASDDNAVQDVILQVDGQPFYSDTNPPYSWNVSDIEEGVYELMVVATDLADNTAESAVVTIIVGNPPNIPMPTDGDDTDTDSGGSDTEGGTDSAGAEGDGGGGDKGCGCRGGTPLEGLAWLGLVLGLGAIRRRR